MRSYMLFALLIVTASCGSSNSDNTKTQPVTTKAAATDNGNMEEATSGPIDPKTKKDPVCGMDWDTEWTEKTVYNGDTIRFCSEGCKMAFDARPTKYVTAKY